MEGDHSKAPAYWVEELARADEDIAHGNVSPADLVLSELRAELAELEAELAAEAKAPVGNALRR